MSENRNSRKAPELNVNFVCIHINDSRPRWGIVSYEDSLDCVGVGSCSSEKNPTKI